eukprot:364409-Chlamydomonas_euryale.AAC.22
MLCCNERGPVAPWFIRFGPGSTLRGCPTSTHVRLAPRDLPYLAYCSGFSRQSTIRQQAVSLTVDSNMLNHNMYTPRGRESMLRRAQRNTNGSGEQVGCVGP